MANGEFGGGSGTAAFPYLVEDAEDLDAVRNHLGNQNVHFMQVADIDLADWGNWLPIQNGTSTSSSSVFRGTYNGDGYVIKNMGCEHLERNYVGLFGYSSGGNFSNIGLENIHVVGVQYVGGLNGGGSSTITNSYTTGDVTGDRYVGGLNGGGNNSTITNSYTTGDVTGDQYVGGLIGGGTTNAIINATNSYATGDVSGDRYVGGLIGGGGGGVSTTTVTNSYATGDVTGVQYVGGILGRGNNTSFVSSSFALMDAVYRSPGSTFSDFGDIIGSGGETFNCYSLNSLEFRQL